MKSFRFYFSGDELKVLTRKDMKETLWSDSFTFIFIEGIQIMNSRHCDFTCIIKKDWNLPENIGNIK